MWKLFLNCFQNERNEIYQKLVIIIQNIRMETTKWSICVIYSAVKEWWRSRENILLYEYGFDPKTSSGLLDLDLASTESELQKKI
jgi:hypothetical protein